MRPRARLAALAGGAVLLGGAAALSLMGSRGGDRPETGRPTLAAAPSPPSSPSSPSSAPLQRGMDARALGLRLLTLPDPGEVRAGMTSLAEAAEQGDVEAQIALGRIYLKGVPAVPKDAARAREWLLRAAPSRHPSAAYFLGVMSQNGEGSRADPAEAARWFEIAAQGGSPDAMFLLANAYRAGAGVPKDDRRAVELYESAGELEHPAALQALAMAYLHGELGLEPSEAENRRYMMEAEHAIKHRRAPP
ncbi:tetratricopeptide repeat protein [Sorangium sp. So ce1078]|uniref:tetratricopeptide repeat protein n=1 Tax=Sorangium sp. So ce1078 TaxID=3133329 RepID=UPI003F5DCD99